MSTYDRRLATLTIADVPIPVGSDGGPTITRQPEVRFGPSIGGQPPAIEWVGDPNVTIAYPVQANTSANRLLAAAAAECFANGIAAAPASSTLKQITATTADGFSFGGLGYVMAPTDFANGTATPERAYTIMIPNAAWSPSGVAAALSRAGVIG